MAIKNEQTVRVSVAAEFGAMPSDKDAALRLQDERLVPAVREGKTVVFDFAGVEFVSQSFAGALVAALHDELGPRFSDRVDFENTNPVLHAILSLPTRFPR